MEIPDDRIVPFIAEVAAAADGLALSIYDTTRSKKSLTVAQHRAIKDAVPRYLMVKANPGTAGVKRQGVLEPPSDTDHVGHASPERLAGPATAMPANR